MTIESPFIVRGATIEARTEARAIVAEAESQAQQVLARTDDERHAVLEEARREGFRKGLAEAAAVTARAAEAVDLFWQERGSELREVALAVAHRVLSSLPSDEIVARLAAEAVTEHARDSRLELRAAPETTDVLRALLQSQPTGDRVLLSADPSLPREACTLLHPRGRSEIGLLAQFRSLMVADPTKGPSS